MQKEWYEEGQQVTLKQLDHAYKSKDPTILDYQYETRDAEQEAWKLLQSDTPEEEKERIRKKQEKREEGAQAVVIRPSIKKKLQEAPFVRREIMKERQAEIKKALEEAFERALGVYDDQQLSLFQRKGYKGKPIFDYMKRQRLAKFDESKGKYKLNENAFLLRVIWALSGDALFEALARSLSGKTIKFPTVEQQLRANQKHIIYEAREEYAQHKKRYKFQERKDAALLEDLDEIGERVRDGFIKETDYMKKHLGVTFLGELPDQIDDSRVSQIWKEEQELNEEFEEYRKDTNNEDATTNEVRRILARLTFLGSLKQLLYDVREKFYGV